MTDFSIAAEICTIEGTPLLDMEDDAAGYHLVSAGVPDESWRRIVTSSPVVDGDFEVAATLDAGRLECVVRVEGSSWAQVESRRLALRDAYTHDVNYLLRLTIEGVGITYRARRPDVTSVVDTTDLANNRRLLALSFPVQPNPIVTGV